MPAQSLVKILLMEWNRSVIEVSRVIDQSGPVN